ncbi:MAG: arsenate reductase ArsC [Bacteroidetes bacterium]|nr:arsenate reductase ArsC [Bacteroidota bacterium]
MKKTTVLFVSVHNSARSQMAEAFLNLLAGNEFQAESAGREPTMLNPIVVKVMKEINIDISGNQTKRVFDLFKDDHFFNFIITVCDKVADEHFPVFPMITRQINWSFKDPATFTGTHEEILAETRIIRDEIKLRVENFVKTHHLVKF